MKNIVNIALFKKKKKNNTQKNSQHFSTIIELANFYWLSFKFTINITLLLAICSSATSTSVKHFVKIFVSIEKLCMVHVN